MSVTIKIRQGLDTNISGASTSAGEPLWVTDTNRLYVSDGSTKYLIGGLNASGEAGGANTQVQFNNSDTLDGHSGFTYDGSGTVSVTGQINVDDLTLNGTEILNSDNGDTKLVLGLFPAFTADNTTGDMLTIDDSNGTPVAHFSSLSAAANNSSFLFQTDAGNVTILGVNEGATSATNIILDPEGAGVVDVSTSKIINIVDPTANQDAATKKYVDDNVSSVGGTTTQMQYNNAGAFAGDTGFTTDGAGNVDITGSLDVDNLNLNGNAIISTTGDITITPNGANDLILDGLKWPQADGTPDYVLKTNGSGQLAWVAQTDGNPAGTDTQIQYNNAGAFAGDTGFTTDGAGNVDITGSLDVDNININGNTISATAGSDIIFLPNGSAALSVLGTTNYENDVTHDDDIPNKRYVDDQLASAAPGGSDTQLQYNDNGAIGGDTGFTTDGAGAVDIVGDLDVDNINLNGNTLSITDTNGNLTLKANGNGSTILTDGNSNATFTLDEGTMLLATGSTAQLKIRASGTADPMVTFQRGGADTTAANVYWDDTADQLIINTSINNGEIILNPHGSGVVNVSSTRIINVSDPTAAQDAATKSYVDSTAAGLDPKESVRVATTADITLSGLQAIDGITVVASDRVLVKDQSTVPDNGIYTAAAGGWSRASDHDGTPANEISGGNFTFVEVGSTQASTGWVLQGDGILSAGVDDQNWVQFSGSGTYTAGDGLTLTGAVFSANTTGTTTTVVGDNLVVGSTSSQTNKFLKGAGANTEGSWQYVQDLRWTNGALILDGLGGGTDYLQIDADTTGTIGLVGVGTSSDIDIVITPKGTGQVDFSGSTLVNGVLNGGTF